MVAAMAGYFLTLEGPDGSGKSTLAEGLQRLIEQSGRTVTLTREPGATHVGRKLRDILLKTSDLTREAELFLFLADRAEHVQRVINPALERGDVVISDRFSDSTVVYQGMRGFEVEWLRNLCVRASRGQSPFKTILLDLPPELSLARIKTPDRIERENLRFHEGIRKAFLEEAERDRMRWTVLDASQPPEEVLQAAWSDLMPSLMDFEFF